MFSKTLKISVLSAAIATLAACGGGGGGSSTTAYTSQEINGVAVDFYLANATIEFSNKNCTPIKTDAKGEFTFKTTDACQKSAMIITGGTDLGTNLPFTGRLQLKETDFNQVTDVTVTPLTTLEKHLDDAGQLDKLDIILLNLGISQKIADLTTFNPVANGDAKTAAASFALQQLVNKIEDNLQAVKINGTSAFTADQAAAFAFAAVIDVVQKKPLFKADALQFDTDILNEVLDQAVEKAQDQLDKRQVDAFIPKTVLTSVADDSVKLATSLDTLVKTAGNGEALFEKLKQDPTEIQTVSKTPPAEIELPARPIYADFAFADHTLSELNQSSKANPVILDVRDIDKVLDVDFGIQQATAQVNDSFKIGFSIQAQVGTHAETLDVILDEVKVSFDETGRIATATIQQGTLLTVNSSMKFPIPGQNATTSYIQVESPRSFSLNNNYSISLAQLLASDSRLVSAYDQYKSNLRSGSTLNAKILVQPKRYQIDPTLSLLNQSMTIKNDSFSAPGITAYLALK